MRQRRARAIVDGSHYVLVLLTLGLTTLRKGHGWMFLFGIFLPLFWLIGAFIGPTATVEAACDGR
jgi:hypothetical protein